MVFRVHGVGGVVGFSGDLFMKCESCSCDVFGLVICDLCGEALCLECLLTHKCKVEESDGL